MSTADTDEADTPGTPPPASSDGVRRRMQAMPRRDTAPELLLRRELYRRGLRYRVDYPALPAEPRRRVDIGFTREKVAVFVDGCFWHGCPEHGTRPKTNSRWWSDKIDRNRQRDHAATEALTAAGWLVLRVWEHEAATLAADRLIALLRQRSV